MVKNLAEKGSLDKPILIYNRTTSRAEALHEKVPHTTVATTLEAAIDPADIIFICLGDDPAVSACVDSIVASKAGIRGKLIVDCSTVHPDTTTRIADALTAAGAGFVAMPVFGAPAMADAGQLICIQAGPAGLIERVRPYCKGVMSRADLDFPDAPAGTATRLKLIGNTFILNMVSTLAEGHVVAEKSGLGSAALHRWIEVMWPGPYTAYSNRMLHGDYYKRDEPLFAVDLARKDVRHAQDLARKGGVTMRNVQNGDDLLVKVKEEKGAKGDLAGMYGAKRMEAGLPYENGS